MAYLPVMDPLEVRLKQIRDLPTLPVVVTTILNLLADPSASLREAGDVVSTDPVLSARTLRVVNSPYFGLSRRLTTVAEAAVYLGRTGLRNLTISSGLVQVVRGRDRRTPSLKFWEHAFAAAIYARVYAVSVGGVEPEDAYLAGLVHDIGRLVLQCHFPDEDAMIAAEVERSGRARVDVEMGFWQASHADVADWLGEMWHFPDSVRLAVRHHHAPGDASPEAGLLAACVNLADEAAWEQGFEDEANFDGTHSRLRAGCEALRAFGPVEESPDNLRELAARKASEVHSLVAMVYEQTGGAQ